MWDNGVWENGTWKYGFWKDGQWRNGIWNDGWIYDPDKTGNFEAGSIWIEGYVRSRISPKEYFSKKR
jgi:hypothetical protein